MLQRRRVSANACGCWSADGWADSGAAACRPALQSPWQALWTRLQHRHRAAAGRPPSSASSPKSAAAPACPPLPLRTDEAVQRQRLGENEDEDHAHKQLGLLRVGADAGVAHNADGHAGAQARQTARQAGSKVRVAVEEVVRLVRGLVDCSRRRGSRGGSGFGAAGRAAQGQRSRRCDQALAMWAMPPSTGAGAAPNGNSCRLASSAATPRGTQAARAPRRGRWAVGVSPSAGHSSRTPPSAHCWC